MTQTTQIERALLAAQSIADECGDVEEILDEDIKRKSFKFNLYKVDFSVVDYVKSCQLIFLIAIPEKPREILAGCSNHTKLEFIISLKQELAHGNCLYEIRFDDDGDFFGLAFVHDLVFCRDRDINAQLLLKSLKEMLLSSDLASQVLGVLIPPSESSSRPHTAMYG